MMLKLSVSALVLASHLSPATAQIVQMDVPQTKTAQTGGPDMGVPDFVKNMPDDSSSRYGAGQETETCTDGVCVQFGAISGIDSTGCINSRYDYNFRYVPDPQGLTYEPASVKIRFSIDCDDKDTCSVELNGKECELCKVCDAPSSVRADCRNVARGDVIDECTDVFKTPYMPFRPKKIKAADDGRVCVDGVCAIATAISGITPEGCISSRYDFAYSFNPAPNGTEYLDTSLSVGFGIDCGKKDVCSIEIDGKQCDSCAVCDAKTTSVKADCSNLNKGLKLDQCQDITEPYYLPFAPRPVKNDMTNTGGMGLQCEDGVCASMQFESSIDMEGCISSTATYDYTFLPDKGVDYKDASVFVGYRLDCNGTDTCSVTVDGEECKSCRVCQRNPQSVSVNCRNVENGLNLNDMCLETFGQYFLPFEPKPEAD